MRYYVEYGNKGVKRSIPLSLGDDGLLVELATDVIYVRGEIRLSLSTYTLVASSLIDTSGSASAKLTSFFTDSSASTSIF